MIRYLSANLVRLIAPTNVQPHPNETISTGTCTARLFDERHETALSADEASGQTVLSVLRARSIEVGANVVVMDADAGYHDAGAVTARDLEADTVTVTNAIPAAGALQGARVMTKLGANVSLTAYGHPHVGGTDWGFEGIVPYDQGGLLPGMPVRIEIHLETTGLELLEVLREQVVAGF